MKTRIALKEAQKTKAYCVKCESKIMIPPEVHGEFERIVLANSLRLSMEIRRYPSSISPLGSMLSLEELSVHPPTFFLSKAEAAGGGICSRTNVISVAAFLAGYKGFFFCFWTPLEPAFSVACIGNIFVHLSTCHLSICFVTWPTSKC